MSELHTIHAGGEERVLGCHPRLAAIGSVFPLLESAVPVIPRADWKPCDYSHLIPEILDQDGIGECNACAATMALRACRLSVGLLDVKLSPGHLYGRINGGRDQGSVLSDALEELTRHGCCTMDLVGPLDWRQRNWPAEAAKQAMQYRIFEAFDAPTFDHLASAIQCGFFVDYGILVGDAFSDVDSDGWVAEGRGRGGHALCGCGLVSRLVRGKVEWGILTANSWSKSWGRNGFGVVPEAYFKSETFTDGWAVRVPTRPEDA